MNNPLYPHGPNNALGNASPSGKLDKRSAGYCMGGEHCHVCAFWVEPPEEEDNGETETNNAKNNNNNDEGECTGTCKLVEGDIGADMWCKLFQRSQTETEGYTDT